MEIYHVLIAWNILIPFDLSMLKSHVLIIIADFYEVIILVEGKKT